MHLSYALLLLALVQASADPDPNNNMPSKTALENAKDADTADLAAIDEALRREAEEEAKRKNGLKPKDPNNPDGNAGNNADQNGNVGNNVDQGGKGGNHGSPPDLVNPQGTVGLVNGMNLCFANAPMQALFAHRGLVQAILEADLSDAEFDKDPAGYSQPRRNIVQMMEALQRAFAKMALSNHTGLNSSVDGFYDYAAVLSGVEFARNGNSFVGSDAIAFESTVFTRVMKSVLHRFEFTTTRSTLEMIAKGNQPYNLHAINLSILRKSVLDVEHNNQETKLEIQAALDTLTFTSLPEILLIQLNRARNADYNRVDPSWSAVPFNDTIQFPDHESPHAAPIKYNLYAVVIHTGGYHYYAFVKYGKRWYQANDTVIVESSWEAVSKMNTNFTSLYYNRENVEREGELLIPAQIAQAARDELQNPKSRPSEPYKRSDDRGGYSGGGGGGVGGGGGSGSPSSPPPTPTPPSPIPTPPEKPNGAASPLGGISWTAIAMLSLIIL